MADMLADIKIYSVYVHIELVGPVHKLNYSNKGTTIVVQHCCVLRSKPKPSPWGTGKV
jgi:hypothetical protein